jgi:hypothetical protein
MTQRNDRTQQQREYRTTAHWKALNRLNQARWRKRHPKAQSKKTTNNVVRLYTWLRHLKEASGCSICNERDGRCLDFHHVSGKKEITISVAAQHGWNKDRITEELTKCIVLCANCHRKVHGRVV